MAFQHTVLCDKHITLLRPVSSASVLLPNQEQHAWRCLLIWAVLLSVSLLSCRVLEVADLAEVVQLLAATHPQYTRAALLALLGRNVKAS
jgi:hypothetical protein